MFIELNSVSGVILDIDGFIQEVNQRYESRRNFKEIYQCVSKFHLGFVAIRISENKALEFLKNELGITPKVFVPKAGKSGVEMLGRGPMLRARDSLGLPSHSVVLVSASPNNVSEAIAARLGVVLVGESNYDQEEHAETMKHYPDYKIDGVSDLNEILSGQLLGFDAEVSSVQKSYFNKLFPARTGSRYVNHIETKRSLGEGYPEVKIYFLGRYLDRNDHRHNKHAFSLRIVNNKKNPERHSKLFADLFWGLIKWTREDFDYVSGVPFRPETTDRLKFVFENMPKEIQGKLKRNLLVCPSAYPKQTALSAEQRKDNVRQKFKVNTSIDVSGKTVIVLDDVFTTGSTILECVKILYDAGAKKVIPICLGFHVFPVSISGEQEVVLCPTCSGKLIPLIRKADGLPFFSCSNYFQTKCNGSKDYVLSVRALNELGNPNVLEVEETMPEDIEF
jgi:hypothetical protein